MPAEESESIQTMAQASKANLVPAVASLDDPSDEQVLVHAGEPPTYVHSAVTSLDRYGRGGVQTYRGRGARKATMGSIVFENVTFAYPGSDPVLDGLTLEVIPGEKISLIGRSGVGKTTLLHLLLGFLTPQQGRILVDGEDISGLNKNAYRKQFGVVSQSDLMFAISLRENLLFGLGEKRSDEEILQVLASVNLREDIEAASAGLDTIYSDHIFSGGQKQRMFIARALLRRPNIVLLDEPTSALDFENEGKVLHALESLAADRSTISIAHRLSTVRSSTRIVVLEDKRVLASGTHDELYESNDYYRSLCKFNSFMV
jgi:ATP-binding cassette, subfamily B, bacterial